jgi:hypothetical protein
MRILCLTISLVVIAVFCTVAEELRSSLIAKATATIGAEGAEEAVVVPSAEPTEASASNEAVPNTGSAKENVEIAVSARVNHSATSTRGDQTYTGLIDVELIFTGGVAADAYRFNIISLTGEGNPNEPLESTGRIRQTYIRDERVGLHLINHSERDTFTDELVHPDNGFRFTVTFLPMEGMEKISRLSGMLEVHVLTQVIVIDNVMSLINSEIKHPELDTRGNFSLIKHESADPSFYQLNGLGQDLEPISIRLLKPNGEYLYPDGIVWFKGDDNVEYLEIAGFHGESLEGRQLEFTLAYDTFELPFELINISIEP